MGQPQKPFNRRVPGTGCSKIPDDHWPTEFFPGFRRLSGRRIAFLRTMRDRCCALHLCSITQSHPPRILKINTLPQDPLSLCTTTDWDFLRFKKETVPRVRWTSREFHTPWQALHRKVPFGQNSSLGSIIGRCKMRSQSGSKYPIMT